MCVVMLRQLWEYACLSSTEYHSTHFSNARRPLLNSHRRVYLQLTATPVRVGEKQSWKFSSDPHNLERCVLVESWQEFDCGLHYVQCLHMEWVFLHLLVNSTVHSMVCHLEA